jgi:pimeloyl-ACP methyl ester carboxylesterase
MSSTVITPGDALWISASSGLKSLDQPLCRCLKAYIRIHQWDYHLRLDDPVGLDPAIDLLYDYVQTFNYPIPIMGHGLGGVLGLLFAQKFPQLVHSLTLLAVSAHPAATWHAHYYMQRLILDLSREQILLRMAQRLFGTQRCCRIRALATALGKDLDTSPVPHSLWGLVTLQGGTILTPTLICGSQDDPIVDPEALSQWQEVLKSTDQMWVCPEGRHFFHYLYPQCLADRIQEFWQSVSLNLSSVAQ